ncbi:MAG: hypothetical protein PVH93_02145 [Nitrosopumilaceae archaeon]
MPYEPKSDGRYSFAMNLSKQCRQDRACRHCEGEWFSFGTLRPNDLYSFSQDERRLIRTLDPNWVANHQKTKFPKNNFKFI